jgi:hypothetical protein
VAFRVEFRLISAFDRKALQRFMRCWSVFGKEMGCRVRSYVLCKVSKIYQFEKDDPTGTIVHSMSLDVHD